MFEGGFGVWFPFCVAGWCCLLNWFGWRVIVSRLFGCFC